MKNVQDAVQALQAEFPDVNVVMAGTDEAVAEIQEGYAIALIGPGGSRPHFHERAEENYRVVEGSVPLAVRLGEKGQVLRGEDEFGVRIPCNLVHNAAGVGGWARVEVRCHPVWSKDDHFEV